MNVSGVSCAAPSACLERYCHVERCLCQLYNEIQLKTAHNKIFMEQLTYHACSTESDAEELMRKWALVPRQVLEDLDE